MRPIRRGHPDGVNYYARYPVAKGVRDYFSHDVVRAIDVRVEAAPIRRAIEPPLEAPPTEEGGRMGRIVDRQWRATPSWRAHPSAGRNRCASSPCGSMDGHECQRMTMVVGKVFNT